MTEDFSKRFENVEKSDQKIAHPLLDGIVEKEQNKFGKYLGHASGGLLSVTIVDTDMKDETLAFILEEHYGVPNAGIRYSLDFGIINGSDISRYGFYTVRGGTANEFDDFHRWYNQIKIINQIEGDTVIGLKSENSLDIYKVNSNRNISRIKRYDFEAEKKKKDKQELEKKAQSVDNFQEKLDLLSKVLFQDYTRHSKYFAEVFQRDSEKIGLIAITTYDRDYDPNIERIYFYGVRQEDEKPNLLYTHKPAYRVYGRFFCAGANVAFQDLGGEIEATMNYYYTYFTPSMHTKWSEGPKQEKVKLKI